MLTKRIRRAAVRRCLALAVIAVPLASLAIANPSWAKSAGIDVWNVPGLEQELVAADRAHEHMAGVDATLLNRIALKEMLITELIAGRATLADVSAQFLSLNAERPEFFAILRLAHPDCTDEECAARNVLEYVRQRVSDAEREDVACRLSAELADLLRDN